MSVAYPQYTTFQCWWCYCTGGNKAIRINAGFKLSKLTLHSKGKNILQSARLLAPSMLPKDGAFSESWKYKECLVLQHILGIQSCLLPVKRLVKAGTGLNATFATGDLSLSYSQLSMHEHYPCTHLMCWQTFNAIQCRLTQERADLAASLVQLGEKTSELHFRSSSLEQTACACTHPRYCQTPQLPVISLSVLFAGVHSSSSVTAWPSKGLTRQLSWKMPKLFSEMGQEPFWWKQLVAEAPHIQMNAKLFIFWSANRNNSMVPHCCDSCYPRQPSLQASLWQRKVSIQNLWHFFSIQDEEQQVRENIWFSAYH